MTRLYGTPPYRVAVLHGGPGAPGTVACMARRLAADGYGVLEPLQSAETVAGLIEELHQQLEPCDEPVALVGHSWGAWLGLLYAAAHPERVERLALVGCGPLEDRYRSEIGRRREKNLSPADAAKLREAIYRLETLGQADALEELGRLAEKADHVAPIPQEHDDLHLLPGRELYTKIWPQAAALRSAGRLIEALAHLSCPVLVLHGEQDSHPPAGILEPLRDSHVAFTAQVFPRCGHSPFLERYALEAFYHSLEQFLG